MERVPATECDECEGRETWVKKERTFSLTCKCVSLRIKHLLTYSMEENLSWEAKLLKPSQEIPRILWNPNVHYHYHESARNSPYPTSHILKILLNIILPSTPVSPQWTLSLNLIRQNPTRASPLPIGATCPAHLILLSFITHTIFREQYRTSSSSLCCFLHSPVKSSLILSNNSLLIFKSCSLWMVAPYTTLGRKIYTREPCFTPPCSSATCQCTAILNWRPVIFGLTTFGWHRSITLAPAASYSIIPCGSVTFYLDPLIQEHNWGIKGVLVYT